jgi:ATPase subunit of ABC transporter with duplicated ATPase domains
VLLVSHDRALLDAVAERTAAIEEGMIRLYDGGWADYVRRREELASPPTVAEPKPKPPREKRPLPSARRPTRDPVAEIERRIEGQEALIAKLETKLAEDWSNVDTIAAHRRARQELQTLLGEWEQLVDEVAR